MDAAQQKPQGPQEIAVLADIVGDVVGSNTPEGEKLLAAIDELRRIREVVFNVEVWANDAALPPHSEFIQGVRSAQEKVRDIIRRTWLR